MPWEPRRSMKNDCRLYLNRFFQFLLKTNCVVFLWKNVIRTLNSKLSVKRVDRFLFVCLTIISAVVAASDIVFITYILFQRGGDPPPTEKPPPPPPPPTGKTPTDRAQKLAEALVSNYIREYSMYLLKSGYPSLILLTSDFIKLSRCVKK